MAIDKETQLGVYLKDRRTKLDPAALGFSSTAHFSRFFKANAGVNFSKFR